MVDVRLLLEWKLLQLCLLLIVFGTSEVSTDNGVKRFILDWFHPSDDLCHKCFTCWCDPTHCPGLDARCALNPVKDLDCSSVFHLDGGWGPWSPWGACTGFCGGPGSSTRHRVCDSPRPHNCGKHCEGEKKQTKSCHVHGCATWMSASQSSSTTTVTHNHSSVANIQMAGCDKLCTVSGVAVAKNHRNTAAPQCSNGNNEAPEALLLECCAVPDPKFWRKGQNVMQNCGNIEQYAPVGKFQNGVYRLNSGGVFIACSKDGTTGFLMAIQSCDNAPTLEHVTNNGTTRLTHPEAYFVISD